MIFVPRYSTTIEEKHIPLDVTGLQDGDVLAVPGANQLVGVPEVGDAVIGQEIGLPARAVVALDHVEPDREHAEVRVGVLVENFILRPPGASDADRSRGREQQYDSRHVLVRVECLDELVEAFERHEILLPCEIRVFGVR